MESGFGQQRGLVPLPLIASAQDGDPPATRRFRHLTDARVAIVEAFKALPDIDYQPIWMLHDQEGL
jgi:hypothetical protein